MAKTFVQETLDLVCRSYNMVTAAKFRHPLVVLHETNLDDVMNETKFPGWADLADFKRKYAEVIAKTKGLSIKTLCMKLEKASNKPILLS